MHHPEDYIVPQPLTDPNVDLIRRVVQAAHREGLTVYLLFKPFETGQTTGFCFPPDVKLPPDAVTIQSVSGTHGIVCSLGCSGRAQIKFSIPPKRNGSLSPSSGNDCLRRKAFEEHFHPAPNPVKASAVWAINP